MGKWFKRNEEKNKYFEVLKAKILEDLG